MVRLSQGRIVWASVSDPQGRNQKERPLVVISENSESAAAEQTLIVVAVTTQTGQAPSEACIPLPWSRQSGCITKLTSPSSAVCTWLCKIPKSSITKIGGLVPPHIVKKIIAKASELLEPPN